MGDCGERIINGHHVQHLAGCIVFWKRLHRCWNLAFTSSIISRDFGVVNRAYNSWSARLFDCLGFLYSKVMFRFLLFWSTISFVTNQIFILDPQGLVGVLCESLFNEDLGAHTLEVDAF